MKKLYDIEIVVCPELIAKHRESTFKIMSLSLGTSEWTEETWDAMEYILNVVDEICYQINKI